METKTALRRLENVIGRAIMEDADRDEADRCLETLWDKAILGR